MDQISFNVYEAEKYNFQEEDKKITSLLKISGVKHDNLSDFVKK